MPKAPAWLKKLRCPRCGLKSRLAALAVKKGDWGAWGVPGLRCARCGERYPVQSGVLRMIPKGDYKRYAYWETMHSQVDTKATIDEYHSRDRWAPSLKDDYYVLPRLARKAGWSLFESALELGCGWGTYTLSLARAGMLKE